FEKDLKYIKRGATFSGNTEVSPENEIIGEITSIDNFADPSSRTIRVVGKIKNKNQKYLSESSFTGQVLINLGSEFVVPEKSVLFTGRGSFVYIYRNEKLYPQKVTLGPKVGEEYVVIKGISEGDRISSGPNFLIDSESKIRGLND